MTIEETAGLVRGLRTVANALCDIIVKLTEDLCVCSAEEPVDCFFERVMEGRSFTEVLDEGDKIRFKALVSSVSGSQVHACMPVTLKKTSSMCEAHLLLVDTGRTMPRYFLGIRVEMEHLQDSQQIEPSPDCTPPATFMGIVPQPPGIPNMEMKHYDSDQDSGFSFGTYKNMAVETWAYTSVRARAISLKKVMPRWNIPRDATSCCQFHTVVDSIHEVADFLTDMPCEPLWNTLTGGQCPRCKSMCTQARAKCVVCGYHQK